MPFLEISPGHKMHYLEENPSGYPTVLLLHGLGADCTSWLMQIPDLTKAGYRVLAPDARGFGKSSYPGGGVSIRLMTEDFARLVRSTCEEPVHVVGLSMGGLHALQLCLDYPGMVDKLVLVNTFASLRPEKLSVWGYLILRFIIVHTLGLPAQAKFITRRIFPRDDQEFFREELYRQIMQANPRGYRAAMRAIGLYRVNKRLLEIARPTLVVTGECDTTVPPKSQRVIAEGIRGARQVIVPGAGHAVTIDQTVIFNQVMLDFLNGTS